jgi:hypothetical protein
MRAIPFRLADRREVAISLSERFSLTRRGVVMAPTAGDPNEIEGVLNPALVRGREDQLHSHLDKGAVGAAIDSLWGAASKQAEPSVREELREIE